MSRCLDPGEVGRYSTERVEASGKKRVLFVCGSINQTTQMEQIAAQLPEVVPTFAPYWQDGWGTVALHLGLLESTIGGKKLQRRCVEHLQAHGLEVDLRGDRHRYDLVFLSSDLRFMANIRKTPVVLVQEGIFDPPNFVFPLIKRFNRLPRWLAGTAATGLSKRYRKFCVASAGYRDHFIRMGCAPDALEVTGMPNFDDCTRYSKNDFPHHGYVLACTSDARETLKCDDRKGFVERAVRVAAGRALIFKLHPNENLERANRELRAWAPHARVYSEGRAEEMVANCDVLICQYSTLAFVGVALGKEVHSYFPEEELRRLLPLQNRSAARNIADVGRRILDSTPRRDA